MRLSIDDMKDYDEKTFDLCCRCVVLLDGVEIKNCTEADEENGFIIRYKLSSDGHPYLVGNEFETEKLNGHVQIIDPLEKQQ